jgi:hypothetical protein
MITVGIITLIVIPEAKGFSEDQVQICSYFDDCFIVNIDQFFTEKQEIILDKSFISIKKIENISEADKLECYLQDAYDRKLYCLEERDD